jgi:hypothetical protein
MTEPEASGIALSAAYGVALRARTGGLQAHEVDGMRVQAEELLARDSNLRTAILRFCTMYELDHHNPDAVREHGEELDRNISRALAPAGVDNARRDIHG